MSIFDQILGLFGIKRIILDKPLTLLRQDYYKVMDKVHDSMYFSWQEDVDWEDRYIRNDEEDRNVNICQWETVRIIHTIKHDESDKIVSAGRIYVDRDEDFLDKIVEQVTASKRRITGNVRYRFKDWEDDEQYYYHSDDICLLVHKYDRWYEDDMAVHIEYVLCEPPKSIDRTAQGRSVKKSRKDGKRLRTVKEYRQRIMNDLDHLLS